MACVPAELIPYTFFVYLCIVDKLNKIIEGYPVELKMLLVCCGSERWKVEDLLPSRTLHPKGSYAHETIDWERFYQWMRRHRVAPAVYRYIKKNPAVLPEEVVTKVKKDQERITRRTLLLTSELIRIGKLLDENNIPWFTMKGPVLARHLYGDVAGRDYRDLDIFVKQEDLVQAFDILKKSGYTSLLKLSLRNLVKIYHHIELFNSVIKTKVELHWKLFANEYLFQFSKNETCSYFLNETNKIPTIDKLSQSTFIIIHNAQHQWNELQWLIDSREILNDNEVNNTISELLISKKLSVINNLVNDLTALLFNKVTNEIHAKSYMVADCLKAIVSQKATISSKIKKTRYLFNISGSKNYKINVFKLRLKFLFLNPKKRIH